MSCYICGKVVTGYQHFKNAGSNASFTEPGATCPLWDNTAERSYKEVRRAQSVCATRGEGLIHFSIHRSRRLASPHWLPFSQKTQLSTRTIPNTWLSKNRPQIHFREQAIYRNQFEPLLLLPTPAKSPGSRKYKQIFDDSENRPAARARAMRHVCASCVINKLSVIVKLRLIVRFGVSKHSKDLARGGESRWEGRRCLRSQHGEIFLRLDQTCKRTVVADAATRPSLCDQD